MVDILMATYNGEKYIKEQLQTILDQSCKECKLIIHDDGSTDNTVKLIKEVMERYPERIQYIEDGVRTGGAKNNFFHLLKFSTAKYIMFADQDDVWQQNKVENALNCIKKYEKQLGEIPLMGYSDLVVVDEKLQVINKSFFDMQALSGERNAFNNILVQNIVTGCTVIFNRELLVLCKEMPKEAIMHDWWMALIAAGCGKLFLMKNRDILYRQHGNNTEGAKDCKNPMYLAKKLLEPAKIKKSMLDTRLQAKAFKNILGEKLNEKNRNILNKYIMLDSQSKLERLRTIKKFDFEKNGFIKKIVQKIMI